MRFRGRTFPPPCGEGGPKGRVGFVEGGHVNIPTGSVPAMPDQSPASPQGGGKLSASLVRQISKNDISIISTPGCMARIMEMRKV